MAGYRYSLALVSAVITFPGASKPVRFGGQGSMIGSITLSRKNDRFSSEGDATGGFVINETLDKTGTCVISIKQFAPLVSTLTNLFNKYDNAYSNYESAVIVPNEGEVEATSAFYSDFSEDSTSIELYYNGKLIGRASYCYLNMPELTMEEENGSRDFTFECGSVDFDMLDDLKANDTAVTSI